MARPATGSVRERRGKNGTTYAIRFRAYGQRHQMTLGSTEGAGPEPEPRPNSPTF